MRIPFKKADILLPKDNFDKWAVIACDQFTSDKKYWSETQAIVGKHNSTLNITLPEIYLEDNDTDSRISKINQTMNDYLANGVLCEYEDVMIYIERTQPDGRIRQGIIGAVDLEEYDYTKGSKRLIRATEGTVLERIPPRVKIRKDAPLELPHIMLLIDDATKSIIEPLADQKDQMKKIYDFDLMMEGGHINGYILSEDQVNSIIEGLEGLVTDCSDPLLFAVGDGNHSLATAKACYEQLKKDMPEKASDPLARYALAEVGNIHSDALDFEPIYRILFNVDPEDVLFEFKKHFSEEGNEQIKYFYGKKEGSVDISLPEGKITTGVVQDFIDLYLNKHTEAKVDYIHGINDLKKLAATENAIGFAYSGITKNTLFESVKTTGALPRKTFSMGESRDKRYYIECRKIK